jgi:hypothetical protein
MAKKKQPKKQPLDADEEEYIRQWRAMNNSQRADLLLKQYTGLTKNDNEYAKAVGATEEDLKQLKRDLDAFRAWGDYERFANSLLDRDLVADAKAVKLFDNQKDPRDRSDEPEPPEHLRDKVMLLWPFD